jgi:hypothetical protein
MTTENDRDPKGSVKADVSPHARLIADEQHPDHLSWTFGEGASVAAFTPNPDGPIPGPFPGSLPGPFPGPLPGPSLPGQPVFPWPPLHFCSAVSGRYSYTSRLRPVPASPSPFPLLPLRLLTVTVRVDVDRFYPQRRISIQVSRLFPKATAHAIAEVTSDECLALNRRRVTANITYRDGDASLIVGDQISFDARRTRGLSYDSYRLTLSGAGVASRSYDLEFESQFFDSVEFEVDRVADAGVALTSYDVASHPNRPADLPSEALSFATIYQRAGFDVTMSPNTSVLPTVGTGANTTWSDSEMHNAMVTYWSRHADRAQWALWILYARQHDQGRSLGGVMFDDIGAQHRQGTAIFTDSFIQDVPDGDANPAAWRQRMTFWTAIHEMGHAFNLAHAWQKALGVVDGAPGDPWIPLANEPESRSFMNYPFRVAGGESSFFSDFRFRFTDDELLFMRHAPRRFVQMGNSEWFVNHGFEAPNALERSARWDLRIRPNRELNRYSFLEPVVMELKLTNTTARAASVEEDLLADGRHIRVFIQREGGLARQWRPLISRCHHEKAIPLGPNASLYGTHPIGISTGGFLIDEPGFYKVQAALTLGSEVIVSNVLRLYVAPPSSQDESALAPDYFTEEVGRVLAFDGAPSLVGARDTLQNLIGRCPTHPASLHARVALSAPLLRDYKELHADSAGAQVSIRSSARKVDEAARSQKTALLADADLAADTLGHIHYFGALDRLAKAMASDGDPAGAKGVLEVSIRKMEQRQVVKSALNQAQRELARVSGRVEVGAEATRSVATSIGE